jgi:arylsulfatase A-like enzyme
MRHLFFWSLLLILSQSCRNIGVSASEAPAKPNIIFIMTDDHAYQAISAYGSQLIHTPEIDKLAEAGVLFDLAFVTNSICAPSRAVILTGKFSHLNGVRDNGDIFDSTQLTYPKLLQVAGYQTAVVGKWHLKTQPTGFDYWKVLPGQGDYYHPEFRTKQGVVKEEGYVTDIITDLAINFLDSIRDPTKPFMLMYQHKAPHREWWPAQEDLGTFRDKTIPEPSTLFDDYSGRPAAIEAEMRISEHMGLTNDNKIHPNIATAHGIESFMGWYDNTYLAQYERLTTEEKQKWDAVYGPINSGFDTATPEGNALTSWKYRRYLEDYLGTISSVDRNVGRLMQHLDARGLTENTLVIYTSDQGFYLGEHGWFDKRFMYEQSFRTPLIMRWPIGLVKNIHFVECSMHSPGNFPRYRDAFAQGKQ